MSKILNKVKGYFTPSQIKLKENLGNYTKLKENLEIYKKMKPNTVINSIGNLSRFHDFKDKDNLNNTILHIAIENNWIPVVLMLLSIKEANYFNRKKPNYFNSLNDYGATPLTLAIAKKNIDIINILLNNPEININFQNNYGNTALMSAIHYNLPDIVDKILEKPDLKINLHTTWGDTALMQASQKKSSYYVSKILQNPNVEVNLQDNEGRTALMFAVKEGLSDNVNIILKYPGIEINLQDKYGKTALIIAAYKSSNSIDEILVYPNLNVNLQEDRCGNTALMWAIYYKMPQNADKILDHPDIKNNININIKNNDGMTALMYAIEKNLPNIALKILKRPDVDINIKNNNREIALMYAIKYQLPNIAIKILERSDVDINIKNNDGEIALMYAIKYQLLDIAIKILEHPDFDINIKNNKGQTAFDFARHNNLNSFIILIIEKILQKFSINNFFEFLFKNKLFNLLQTYLVTSDLKLFINNITMIIINMANSISMANSKNININNKDINKDTKNLLYSINKSMNKNNLDINNLLYNFIINFLKTNYNLRCESYSSITMINPIKGSALLTICELFKNINTYNIFYNKIQVVYKNKNGRRQGINAGGLTRNFFFECHIQVNELFSNFMSKNKSKNTTENTSINTSKNTTENTTEKIIKKQKIEYYNSLKTIGINWSDCIIVVYLLIFSKINNCPICLDESYFSIIAQPIYNLILIDTNYTLKQKVFIINMLKLYKDINKKKLQYGIYSLLLTDRQSEEIVADGRFSNTKYIIETYISETNKKEENRNKKNKNYMNDEIAKLQNNIQRNDNKSLIVRLILDAISKGIYKDLIDFYYTHFISEIVTFESFMKNLKFINEGSDFRDEIIKLLNYMNHKDPKNILLLSQAMTGNTFLQKEYKIKMFSGKKKILEFHTCFHIVDLFKDNFQIITEDEVNNEKVLNKFMDLVNTSIKSNFIG